MSHHAHRLGKPSKATRTPFVNDGDKTDQQLAGKISSVTRPTDEEVKEMSDPADVKKLGELMEIVKRSGDKNDKINKIVANAEDFAGII